MKRPAFSTLNQSVYDICIIGGGATGAGCALDAALRGHRVLLVEKTDFGAATSSKSTKLIHGGVRYLEQAVKKLSLAQLKMVHKALKERTNLLKLAPHCTRPISLLTPCRTWVSAVYYYIGLKIYELISGKQSIGKSRLLSRTQATQLLPILRADSLFSAVLYYDGQLDDLRYNLAIVQTAYAAGATCINHCSVIAFEDSTQTSPRRLLLRDHLTQQTTTISANLVINATGPFSDTIRLMANANLTKRIRVSKGVHITLPLPSQVNQAMLIPETRDGRVLFAIPYKNYLLVGTTDENTELSEDELKPSSNEISFILEHIQQFLDIGDQPQVMAGFGGLRPLVQQAGMATHQLVRDHEVEVDATSGLVSILGGKWTTYRLMARDTIDTAEKILGKKNKCTTDQQVLIGSQRFTESLVEQWSAQFNIEIEYARHLAGFYGDCGEYILKAIQKEPHLGNRLYDSAPFTHGELQYVLQHEMACTAEDVVNRRWGLQLINENLATILRDRVHGLMN